jgi:hypothetical protein
MEKLKNEKTPWLIAILTIIGWTASAQPLIEESIRLRAEAAVKAGDFHESRDRRRAGRT